MLSIKHRLRKMKDFDILFKEGRFVSGELADLKIWKIDPAKYPKRDYLATDLKVGFAVSKKISKSAVKRNRIKRQMREVVRLLLKTDKIKVGYMIVLLAKPNILEKEYKDIENSIISILKKASVKM